MFNIYFISADIQQASYDQLATCNSQCSCDILNNINNKIIGMLYYSYFWNFCSLIDSGQPTILQILGAYLHKSHMFKNWHV